MPPSKKTSRWWAALIAVIAAAAPMTWLWGFTVDDALITARVAHQLAAGHGYRFNPTGPATDAVTPLGWVFALVPFAGRGPLGAFAAAKWAGALAWLVAAAWCGKEFWERGRRAFVVGVVGLLVTTPLAAWAVAGMETGVVVALATAALGLGRAARVAAGVAAALRPELAPWALSLLVTDAVLAGESQRERLIGATRAAAWALGPFIAVAVVRSLAFGAAYPLAVQAKPPEFSAGARYALGALALSGPVWLLLAPLTLRRLSRRARAILVATFAHVLALMVVGGDWMPLYRLFVPVLPGVLLVGAEIAAVASPWSTLARSTLGLAAAALIATQLGPSAARVGEQRRRLIEAARPLLAGAKNPATLDIGWVGAATPAHVVDLAGVTDPFVARLGGGHTTKRIPDGFLASRDVDALILLADPPFTPWPELAFARGVEQRVVGLAGADHFRPVGTIPLLGTPQAYVIARREATPTPESGRFTPGLGSRQERLAEGLGVDETIAR